MKEPTQEMWNRGLAAGYMPDDLKKGYIIDSSREKADGATFIKRIEELGKFNTDEEAAEFAEKYLSKGQRVGITGRLQTGKYEDKEGVTRYTTDVIVERITFADGKKSADDEEDRRGKSRKRK